MPWEFPDEDDLNLEMGGAPHLELLKRRETTTVKPRSFINSDKLKWDGLSSSFDEFTNDLEGSMTRLGMGHLLKDSVLKAHKKGGINIAEEDSFFEQHGIIPAQFRRDIECLFGLLRSATKSIHSSHILDNIRTQDGLKAWIGSLRNIMQCTLLAIPPGAV